MRIDKPVRLPRKNKERRAGHGAYGWNSGAVRTLAALALLGGHCAFGTGAKQHARAQPPPPEPQQGPGTASSVGGGSSSEDPINPDRPGIADGSQVVGAPRFQIETGFERDRNRGADGVTREVFFPTLFRFGLSDRWEARVEGNTFSRSRTAGGDATTTMSGFAPVSLGVKYHFRDQGPTGGKPSLGTILRVFPISGTGSFRSAHTQADLRLAADWDFTPNLSLNPNIGVALDEDDQGRVFTTGLFAVTLNVWNRTRTANPFLDLGLQAPEERGGHTALTYDGGIAVILARNYQLDLSVGTGAAGSTPPHPFYAAGVSARF